MQRSVEIDAGQFVLTRLGDGEEDLVLTRSVMASGLFIPLHSHADIESLSVVAGSLDVYLGDERCWFTIRSGESIVVPPGVEHAIRNVDEEPAEVLALMTVKLAEFVRQLGAVAAAAPRHRTRDERMHSLCRLADDYGYWLAPASQSDALRHLPAAAA